MGDKCVGGAKWKPFSLPVNATLVLIGVLGKVGDDQGGVESTVHAAMSLWVAISNPMHNGDKLSSMPEKGRLLD